VVDEERLRPVERRIRTLVRHDVPVGDIAERFRRSPEFIHRVIELSELSSRTTQMPSSAQLRPIERRILRWRDDGASHAEIGPRFNRSPGFIQRVEHLARYKLTR
jgi:IS30 family transposase